MTWLQYARALWAGKRIIDQATKRTQEAGVDPKHILRSKTFWFNAALILLGTIQQIGVIELLPEPYGPALLQIVGAVNTMLRFVTTSPVTVGTTGLTRGPGQG